MKLAMLADVLPRGLLTPAILGDIKRMAQFISLFHGPWFLQARIAPVAPRLDLQLWEYMCVYIRCVPFIKNILLSVVLYNIIYNIVFSDNS